MTSAAGRGTDRDGRFRIAETAWASGDIAQAVEGYRDLIGERLASGIGVEGFDQGDLVVIERLADGALLLGFVDAAEKLLGAMAALLAGAGNSFAAGYAALKRLHVVVGAGRFAAAREIVETLAPRIDEIQLDSEGLETFEATLLPGQRSGDRGIFLSRLHLELGRLLMGLGQYRGAVLMLRRGVLHAERGEGIAADALPQLRLATAGALFESGDLDGASREIDGEDVDERRHPGLHAGGLELRARIRFLRGDLGQAKVLLDRVATFCRERGFERAAFLASLNLAHAYVLLNRTAEAREILAGVAATASDPDLTARATMLFRLAIARSRSLGPALAIAPSVTEMWGGGDRAGSDGVVPSDDDLDPGDGTRPASFLAWFEDRALAFQWRLAEGRVAAARDAFDLMREVFASSDSRLVAARLDALEGMLAYYEGSLEPAALCLERSAEAFREMGLAPERWQAQRVLGWCWARLDRPAAEQRALAAEAADALATVSASLDPAERVVYGLNKWTAEEERIAGEIDDLIERNARARSMFVPPIHHLAVRMRLARLLDALDRHRDDTARRVLEIDATAGAWPGKRDPERRAGLWRRLLLHSRDRATILFLVLPDRVLVACAGWMHLSFGVSPLTRIEIREQVRAWHEEVIAGRDSGPGSRAAAIARDLAERLQIPALLSSLPTRVRSITIVPDDSLHGFPFAAIADARGYLVERYSLSIGFAWGGRRRRSRRADGGALLAGASCGTDDVAPLPGARTELEEAANWMTRHRLRPTFLLDEGADRAAVTDALARTPIAHFACHGLFRSDQPGDSGLVLIPSPGRSEVLTLRDLAGLDLSGLRHATLASCWSADNFVLPGRFVLSLPETIWRAGAESVLGCLWRVEDTVSIQFTRRFYDGLDRMSRAQALQAAQLACLRGELAGASRFATSDPVFWAGYNLYGDPARLRLEAGAS